MAADLSRELRLSLRSLLKRPGFAAVVIISLALAIGTCTTIFTVVDRALLRPLDVEQPERLVAANLRSKPGAELELISYPNYPAYREAAAPFLELAVYSSVDLTLGYGESVEQIQGDLVSTNYFSLLGVAAHLGRTFTAEELAIPVAVLSWNLWQRSFATAPDIVGRTVRLNGELFTIVGVARQGFSGLQLAAETDIWLPVETFPKVATGFLKKLDVLSLEGIRWLQPVGRLRDEVEIAAAEAGLTSSGRRIEQREGRDTGELQVVLTPMYVAVVGTEARSDLERFLYLLALLVGIEFIITCSNIAGMFAVRGFQQHKEAAICLSLGASRGSFVRRLLIENFLLAIAGGLGGLLLARGLLAYLAKLQLPGLPSLRILDVGLDPRHLGFAAALAFLVTLGFGLISAWKLTRIDPAQALRSQTLGPGSSTGRWRQLLVITQVGLALVLLVATGLFLRSLVNALAADPGFRTRNVLQLEFNLGPQGYAEDRARGFYSQLSERLEAMPGVLSSGWTANRPLASAAYRTTVAVEGYEPQPDENMEIRMNAVSPGYFETLGLRFRKGRGFNALDREESAAVAIVNATMARRYWSGGDAVGQTIRLSADRVAEVVGVVEDSKIESLQEEPRAYLYVPLDQSFGLAGLRRMCLLVHTDLAPRLLLPAVQRAIRELDSHLPILSQEPVRESIKRQFIPQQLGAVIFGTLSVFAVVMVAAGIYGLLASFVSQQTREIGLRMALGAQRRQILHLVLVRNLSLVLVGLIMGLAGVGVLLRFSTAFLYGVEVSDPLTLLGALLLLSFVALAATSFPAVRAVRVSPTTALRDE